MQQLITLIREACQQTRDSENQVSFRNSYSGRSMYGSQCVGITGSKRACYQVVGEVIKQLHNESEDTNFDEAVDGV